MQASRWCVFVSLLLGFALSSCETLGSVDISYRDEFVELRLTGDPQVIHYGALSFQKTNQFTRFREASNDFANDLNGKAQSMVMDKEITVPTSIQFKRNPILNYIYKFDNTELVGSVKIGVYRNNILKREITLRKESVLGPAVIDIR